jgi:hemerythrin superfamily protein
MNIYEALQEDHRKVSGLLDQLVDASSDENDKWKKLIDQIRIDLIPHSRAEEAVFYNALREFDESKGIVAHSYKEHMLAEVELRTLGAAKMVDANWTTLVEKFSGDLRHHIQEEESQVFAAARKVFSEEEAEQIGKAFIALRADMAKDANSLLASTVDAVANMLPPRLVEKFRKNVSEARQSAA